MSISENTTKIYYNQLIIAVNAMYEKPAFDITQIRRKFSPYIKTNNRANGFGFRLKGCEYGVYFVCEPSSDGSTYIIAKCRQWGEDVEFRFFVNTNKEFMQKVLMYSLLLYNTKL